MNAEIPADLKFTKEHEWIRVEENGLVCVGISDYAQDALGDVVHVELPAKGTRLAREASFGVVESVKSVSDLYAPVSGEVIDTNDALSESPQLLNEDPYGEAWLLTIKPNNIAEINDLMDSTEYEAYCEELEE